MYSRQEFIILCYINGVYQTETIILDILFNKLRTVVKCNYLEIV